jgi:CRISPR-associated protein Csh1
MLEAIKEWGDFAKNQGVGESCSELKNIKHVLTIRIRLDKISFEGVGYEEFDQSKCGKYLYAKKSSQGINYTPTAIITEPEKTFRNRILNWYRKYSNDKSFNEIYRILAEREKDIITNINDKVRDLHEGVLLTMKFLEGDVEKYLGDYDVYRRLVKEGIFKRFGNVPSWGTSVSYGKCFLCGEEKEVFGFALPVSKLLFATVDKPGFAPDLDREAYVKYMPVCGDCGESLYEGVRFIREHFDFYFENGVRYMIIPHVLNESDCKEIFNIVKKYEGRSYHDGLVAEEDVLLEVVKESKNVFTLFFLFYSEQQSRQVVESFVEEVPPSWLRKMYEAQDVVKYDDAFSEEAMKSIFYKKYDGSLFKHLEVHDKNNWYVTFMEDFCENKNELVDFISSILWRKQISNVYFYFMRKLRQDFYDDDYKFRESVLKSFAVLRFLEKLYMGDYYRDSRYSMSSNNSLEHSFENFFEKYNINESWKKATFAVGVLVRYVLNVQREERGAEPFRDKLRGLMLNEGHVKKLFKESINKIFEYDRRNPKLEEAVGKYLAEAEGKFIADMDEISYYFALGLVLGNIFIYKKSNGQGDKDE